jgi:hypothetical protein
MFNGRLHRLTGTNQPEILHDVFLEHILLKTA